MNTRKGAIAPSLRGKIAGLFRRRSDGATLPPPPRLPGEEIRALPPADDSEMAATAPSDVPDDVDSFAGLAFSIEYVDAEGQPSHRRVTAQAIEARYGRAYLRAFCHERQAARTFRADRIRSLTDLRDGRTYDDPIAYLRQLAGDRVPSTASEAPPDGQDRAFERCRDGIRILMFLARCDGLVHENELGVVSAYCRHRAESERWGVLNYNLSHLLEYADRQFPDFNTFRCCLDRIIDAADTGEHVKMILAHAYAIVAADGVLNPKEREFVVSLQELMQEAGWDLEVTATATGSNQMSVTVHDLNEPDEN